VGPRENHHHGAICTSNSRVTDAPAVSVTVTIVFTFPAFVGGPVIIPD
jgi:hypothetical protein